MNESHPNIREIASKICNVNDGAMKRMNDKNVYKWDEMTARQHDVLIAQSIFRYTAKEDQSFCLDETGSPIPFPHYTTDISAAWEVADKLKIAVIPQSGGAPNELKYLARIYDYSAPEPLPIESFSSTAPEAICKVALKAVGIEIE